MTAREAELVTYCLRMIELEVATMREGDAPLLRSHIKNRPERGEKIYESCPLCRLWQLTWRAEEEEPHAGE